MSEFLRAPRESINILYRLVQNQPLKGATYSNILLSSSEPDIVDTYDPTIPTISRYVTLYWPGGNPENGADLETIALNGGVKASSETASEVMRIRKAILGASIGQAALSRVPTARREEWAAVEAQSPIPLSIALDMVCQENTLPLTVCMTSDVMNREPDTRMMHMWYPINFHPQLALTGLQDITQQGMDQEDPFRIYNP